MNKNNYKKNKNSCTPYIYVMEYNTENIENRLGKKTKELK